MKILFIITSLGMGGAENIVVSLADKLTLQGHNVDIVCLRGEILIKPKCKNIKIYSLKLTNIINIYTVLKKINNIIKKMQPDVIHAHMFHAIIMSRILKISFPDIKLISTAHSKLYGGKFRGLLYKITDRFSDLNTNVSHEATDYFLDHKVFSRNNTITVTNGIDINKYSYDLNKRTKLRDFYRIQASDKIFISVGRFNEAKDYPNLLNAYAKFISHYKKESKLFIIGDGVLRAQIEELIEQLGLANSVTLLGIRHDVNELLNMADIFILSSEWEGFGLVIAEAMATEKVVIATDCGGVKEVLGNYEYLVPAKDSEALTQKMLEVTEINQQDCEQIGKINRQRVIDHYSLDAMVGQWLKLYKS